MMPVIDVGDLKHRVDSWITSAAFAEGPLTHPSAVIDLLRKLLLRLDDDLITSLDAMKRW